MDSALDRRMNVTSEDDDIELEIGQPNALMVNAIQRP
jgi:hypothetical protein